LINYLFYIHRLHVLRHRKDIHRPHAALLITVISVIAHVA